MQSAYACVGRDFANTCRRIEAIIRPDMGAHEVTKLTMKAISDWLGALALSPARLRTAKGASQNVRITADTDEARRRRA